MRRGHGHKLVPTDKKGVFVIREDSGALDEGPSGPLPRKNIFSRVPLILGKSRNFLDGDRVDLKLVSGLGLHGVDRNVRVFEPFSVFKEIGSRHQGEGLGIDGFDSDSDATPVVLRDWPLFIFRLFGRRIQERS